MRTRETIGYSSLRQHLKERHGLVAKDTDPIEGLVNYHERMHSDETARHLDHTHADPSVNECESFCAEYDEPASALQRTQYVITSEVAMSLVLHLMRDLGLEATHQIVPKRPDPAPTLLVEQLQEAINGIGARRTQVWVEERSGTSVTAWPAIDVHLGPKGLHVIIDSDD